MFKALSRIASSFSAGTFAPGGHAKVVETPETDAFPIVVTRSALEAYPDNPDPLVLEVDNYVTQLSVEGRYDRREIPARALQAYHMDAYLTQVASGGHARFIAESGAELAATLADIEAGFTVIDAAEYRVVLGRFTAWLAAHPDATRQPGGIEGKPAADLAKLDRLVRALAQSIPLHPKIAGLIAEAPELMVLPDLQVEAARSRLCSANPLRGVRERAQTISRLEDQLTDPFLVGIGLAAAQLPAPAPVVGLGTVAHRSVDGTPRLCVRVETTEGAYWAVQQEDGVALHRLAGGGAPSGQPEGAGPGAMPAGLEIGPAVASVGNGAIEPAIALAREVKAGAAVDLMLTRLVEPPRVDRVTLRAAGPDAEGIAQLSLYLVLNEGSKAMSAVVAEAEARLLLEPDHHEATKVFRAQIEAHVDEFVAAGTPASEDAVASPEPA